MTIHPEISKTGVAFLYYKSKGKILNREQARKNFQYEKKIDAKLVRRIIDRIHKEQIKMLENG